MVEILSDTLWLVYLWPSSSWYDILSTYESKYAGCVSFYFEKMTSFYIPAQSVVCKWCYSATTEPQNRFGVCLQQSRAKSCFWDTLFKTTVFWWDTLTDLSHNWSGELLQSVGPRGKSCVMAVFNPFLHPWAKHNQRKWARPFGYHVSITSDR